MPTNFKRLRAVPNHEAQRELCQPKFIQSFTVERVKEDRPPEPPKLEMISSTLLNAAVRRLLL